MQKVRNISLWDIHPIKNHKNTKIIKENIHVVFNENNDGCYSSSTFQEFQLDMIHHDEGEEEAQLQTQKDQS